MIDELKYDIWLTLVDDVGPKTASALVSHFGSARAVYGASIDELRGGVVSQNVAVGLTKNREMLLDRAESILALCERSNIRVLRIGDVEYPFLLAQTPDAPHILYVRGNLNLNYGHFLSIVGTRDTSAYGLFVCRNLVRDLKENLPNPVTVSGLALGIDKCAHVTSLECGVPTIAVMPGWVDDIVPQSHYFIARQIIEKNGAIVSDMPPNTVIRGANFLSRNRIVAGLSPATVVVESKLKGGSMVTADIAFGYNREVFTPVGDGSSSFEGNVALIKSNKALVYQYFTDILNELNWSQLPQSNKFNIDTVPEELVSRFSLLPDGAHFSIDQAAELFGLSILQSSLILTKLEICGLVSALHGRMYLKN